MKKKLLFWISDELLDYCLANALQKKYDADYFAVTEVHSGVKKFLDEQSFVKFNKIWHMFDHVSLEKREPDIKFLKKFEEQYKIRIWDMAYAERIFYPQFNKQYKYSRNEILSIIEQQCKLFLSIIENVKPDYLILGSVTRLPMYIIYNLAQVMGINVLVLEPWHSLMTQCLLSKQIDQIDDPQNYTKIENNEQKTIPELKQFLESYPPSDGTEFQINLEKSKIGKIKKLVKFIEKPINEDYTRYYSHFGTTKLKTLLNSKQKSNESQIKKREKFMDENFIRDISNQKFIYFPLGLEPERQLLIRSPFYSNQLQTISSIARSIPVEYKLFVKEHPEMEHSAGWRDINYYQSILDYPNVELIHMSTKPEEIFKKCSLVITTIGSSVFEASFYNKPSIILADSDYAVLPWIFHPKVIDDLPSTIIEALDAKVDPSHLDKYIKYVLQKTVKFDKFGYWMDFSKTFPYEGFLKDVTISVDGMKKFLEKHMQSFDALADEHISRFNSI
jgi:hypothetical protein